MNIKLFNRKTPVTVTYFIVEAFFDTNDTWFQYESFNGFYVTALENDDRVDDHLKSTLNRLAVSSKDL